MTKRVLALDVGTVRIGIAVSDPTGLIAQPVENYTRVSRKADIEHIRELAQQYDAGMILSGLPRLLDGSEGEQAAKTRAFTERVARACELDAVYWDERMTSIVAESVLIDAGLSRAKRKSAIDKLAATVILQSWLDAQNRE
ncbi:MAG: Holliday junction resolvase RuvX [Clostridia bacterium]|nr:Holliday junction resolvase RuvX [Clostridia bacterium]